jgi:hypothetical protein
LVFALQLSLPIWFAFIPEILWRLGAELAVFAKTPRCGVSLQRGDLNCRVP